MELDQTTQRHIEQQAIKAILKDMELREAVAVDVVHATILGVRTAFTELHERGYIELQS